MFNGIYDRYQKVVFGDKSSNLIYGIIFMDCIHVMYYSNE